MFNNLLLAATIFHSEQDGKIEMVLKRTGDCNQLECC